MTILHQDSFNGYANNADNDLGVVYGGYNSDVTNIDITGGRYGGGSLRSLGFAAGVIRILGSEETDLWMGWAFRNDDTTFGTIAGFFSPDFLEVSLSYSSEGGAFAFQDRTGTLIAGGVGTVNTGEYHWIEVHCILGASGTLELWVDGIQIINYSGVTNPAGGAAITQVSIGGVLTGEDLHSLISHHCHWYVLNTNGIRNNTRLGDGRMLTAYAVSDATPNDGTPSTGSSHFAMVDEPYIDYGDTFIAIDNVFGNKEVFNFNSFTPVDATIHSVKVSNIISASEEVITVATYLRREFDGTSYANGPDTTLNVGWQEVASIVEFDPRTNADWIFSGVNTIKAGLQVTTGGGGGDPLTPVFNGDIHPLTSGINWAAQTANLTDSLLWDEDDGEFTFRVRNGENNGSIPDPSYVMRSEWASDVAMSTGANSTFSFSVMVEPGQEPTTNNWFIIGQIRLANADAPLLSFNVLPDGIGGEQLKVELSSQETIGSVPFVLGIMAFGRNVYYDCEVIYRNDDGGDNGYIRVTINGSVMIDETRITGYAIAGGGISYPKFGIFTGGSDASPTDTPIAGQDITVHYRTVTYDPGVVDTLTIVHPQEFHAFSGSTWGALNADLSDSLLWDEDDGEFTFRVRDGERYLTMAFSDPAYVMRSEWYGPFIPTRANSTFAFKVMVEPGQEPTTNTWFIIGQIHSPNAVVGSSPLVALDVRPDGFGGEKLVVDRNAEDTIGGPSDIIGTLPGFIRGVYYDVEIVCRDDKGGSDGFIHVTINGTVIVDFTGITGYAGGAIDTTYPKFGLYTGGNGAVATDIPLSGQDITVRYKAVTFDPGVASIIETTVPAQLVGVRAFTSGALLIPPQGTDKQYRLKVRTTDLASNVYTSPAIGTITVSALAFPLPSGGGTTQFIHATDSQATINAAVIAAGVGGVIVMSNGTYQNKKIIALDDQIFMSDYGATVTMTGSIPITGWVVDTIYHKATGFPPDGYSPGDITYVGSRGLVVLIPNDLYWNGIPYLRVANQVDLGPGLFWVDPSHVVWVTDNPTGVTTTASNQDHAFFGGTDPLGTFPTINGVTFQNINAIEYASPSSRGIFQFEGSTSLTLINCSAQWGHACGLLCQAADVYGGVYSNNGQQGILAYGATGPAAGGTFTAVDVSGNNWAGYNIGNGAGGYKGLLLSDQLVHCCVFNGNAGDAVWYDTTCSGTVSRNTIINNFGMGFHQEDSRIGTTSIVENWFETNQINTFYELNLNGSEVLVTSSSGVAVQNNVMIVRPSHGFMGLSEDPRSTDVTSCNVTLNTVINLGISDVGGASNGEGSPPIFAGTNVWNNNTYYLPASGNQGYSWNATSFNDAAGSKPIDSTATFHYGLGLAAYKATFAGDAVNATVSEFFLPGNSRITTGLTTNSGYVMIMGSWAGPEGSTVDIVIEAL